MIVATIIGALVMDRASRRILLNLSSIGVLGAVVYIADKMGDEDLAKKIEFVPVASLSLFVFALSNFCSR